MKKKKILWIVFLIVLIFVLIFLGMNLYKKSIYDYLHIEFYDKIEIEYGSEIDLKEYIQSYTGEIVEMSSVDTHQVGVQKVSVTLMEKGIQHSFEEEVNVVDTHFPTILLKKDKVVIEYGKEYDPKENIEKVEDDVDGNLDYEIEANINNKKAGNYIVKVTCEDKNGNKTIKEFTVQVLEEVKKTPVVDSKVTYIQGILLVNKQYGLPSSYGKGEDPIAYQALLKLQKAAQKEGYSLSLVSGFRSYEYQKSVFQHWVDTYGLDYAEKISARPGHSEHQTGLAFDVGSLKSSFGDTQEGKWLASHCAEYGFIIRYPKNKTDITGYYYEPWHIRYVGVEHSIPIMQQGLTLEEYLGVKS